ncbi:RNA-directed DNA polymerase, eukaryota, reverse transcriptase zinc-binding domain protein [Tanacetum coccineum]
MFSSPFTHLGVKVGGVMSRIKAWDEVISKLLYRLSKWKLKTLSIGGRLTLIKSVLSYIPYYHMSIFKVPIGVLNSMESIRRIFFNGIDGTKKMAMIGIKFIKAICGDKGTIDSFDSISRRSPWLDIIRESLTLTKKAIDLMDFVRKKVGNGEDSLFWEDNWLNEKVLKHEFPILFVLESSKQITVADKLKSESFATSYRRVPRGGIEEEQHQLLQSHIEVHLDNIPTRLNLSLRGVDIPFIICPICNISMKSTSHLLFSCTLARQLRRLVVRWWELKFLKFVSYEEWLLWLNTIRLSKGVKENFEVMSSDDSMGIVFNCLSKGAVDFLVKPIRKNELKNLWHHVLRKCHSRPCDLEDTDMSTHRRNVVRQSDLSAFSSGVHWWRRVEKVVVGRKRCGGVMVVDDDESELKSGY